jgi:hypothetical protein
MMRYTRTLPKLPGNDNILDPDGSCSLIEEARETEECV